MNSIIDTTNEFNYGYDNDNNLETLLTSEMMISLNVVIMLLSNVKKSIV